MKEILEAKAAQVPEFREKLKKSKKGSVFVETTYDDLLGSGLDLSGTEHTDSTKWPGKNLFRSMITALANSLRRPARSWSTPRQGKHDGQLEITAMIRDLKAPQKRDISGNRKRRESDSSEGE